MKLERFIQRLIPRDEKFFTMLEESTSNLLIGSDLLKKLASSKNSSQQKKLVAEIKEIEHRGDTITHRIFSELNATFVTPLDREDIHLLASALDDILDHIDGSAQRLVLYNIKKFPPAMIRLCDVLHLSIEELHRGIGLMRDLHDTDRLEEVFQRVNQYENDADTIFDQAVADLFRKEKNPITIIKLKEVYVGLETATDKCEDVTNVLEGIVIKHA
jgi:predicted phosphate transport protein (TIGR00153 family)